MQRPCVSPLVLRKKVQEANTKQGLPSIGGRKETESHEHIVVTKQENRTEEAKVPSASTRV